MWKENCKNLNSNGITLIALVVTMIVLLILAGVTIATLTGENGLIKNAGRAKEEQEISEEKEIIELATVQVMKISRYGDLEEKDLQNALDNLAGEGKTQVSEVIDKFEVLFKESKRYYEVDKDGNVEFCQVLEEINNAGDFTKGGILNGSEEKPYKIDCIEDLVELSYSVNGIEVSDGNLNITSEYKSFSNEHIILGRNLNFASKLCYEDSSRKDYGDINGNGKVEELITELTTGKGWISIGGYAGSKNTYGFSGNFNGDNKAIKNMYIYNEEQVSNVGLFGNCSQVNIDNLGVLGTIYCNSNNAGGIIGTLSNNKEVSINNCYYDGKIDNISISGRTGGIIGNCNVSKVDISSCYSKGKIIGHNTANNTNTGGIVGHAQNATLKIENSHNEANIEGINSVGGILGQGSNSEIYNCYNAAEIKGDTSVGGIVGNSFRYIERCYNTAKVTGNIKRTGGIVGSTTNGSKIYQSYNEGIIIGKGSTGGILGSIASIAATNLIIEQCYNKGEIAGFSGIIGDISANYAKIINCYNTGKASIGIGTGTGYIVTSKVVGCYNTGEVTSKYGVITSRGSWGTTYNSYYLQGCGATDTVAIATSSENLKNMATTLDRAFIINDEEDTVTIDDNNKQNVWVNDENNINDGYPILKWQTE